MGKDKEFHFGHVGMTCRNDFQEGCPVSNGTCALLSSWAEFKDGSVTFRLYPCFYVVI